MKFRKRIYVLILLCYIISSFMIYKVNAKSNNSYLNSLNLGTTHYGGAYIFGEIISETKPEIVFKSTDGKIQKEVYIESRGNGKYYFDRHLVEIDFSKSYIFEVTTKNEKYKLDLGNNRILGVHNGYEIEINNSEIQIKDYIPNINLRSLNLGKTHYGGAYIYGEITAEKEPNIVFKSTDGQIIKDVYIEAKGNNVYYFDRHLVEIDTSKKYIFEASFGKSTKNIPLGNNRQLGIINEQKVEIKNNEILISKYEYIGVPTIDLKDINLGTTAKGSKYIYGHIEYYETENNEKKQVSTIPKIVFKSTDNTEEKEVYLQKINNNTYYFDRHIVNLDMNKQYTFYVTSTNTKNQYKNSVAINLGNKNLGINTNKYQIYTEFNKVKFVFESYKSIPQIELKEINLKKTHYGDKYLYGKFTYKEYSNGKLVKDLDNPKIVFKSTDGEVEKDVYLEKIGENEYYFDRHLIGLDLSKQYEFQVCSTDIRNQYKDTVSLQFNNSNFGIYKKYQVENDGQRIYFREDLYNGTANIQLKDVNLGKTERGGSYIYGTIRYTEYINNIENSVLEDPIAVFKSTDGEVEKEVYIQHIGQDMYYFDRHLEGIDLNKQYIFYIKSNDGRNQNQNYLPIYLGNKKLGLFGKYNVKLEATNVRFTINKTRYNGIDVSSWQGDIDWRAVKNAGIDFAIIRVGFRGYGSGKIVLDKKWEQNIQQAKSNGITCGVYFATHAVSIEEAIQEAEFTLNNIARYNITGPVVIDTESSGDGGRADNLPKELRTEIVKAFCERIKSRGYNPMIYASKYWLRDDLDMSKLGYYDVWLAHYTGSQDKPSDYKGDYVMWQYTSSGSVNGINTLVDLNVGYKDY